MITIKLPINLTKENEDILKEYQRQQSIVIKYSYNRFKEDKSELEIRNLIKNLKNIDMVDSWIIQSGIRKAKSLKNEAHLVFKKKFFYQRLQNKISKEEYKDKKLLNLIIIGEAPQKGNRKFELNIQGNNSILCKLSRKIHFNIPLPKLRKNYKNYLLKLEVLSKLNKIAYQVELNKDYIYISFDESLLQNKFEFNQIENRVMALDLNPNYIGYSIIDWKGDNDFSILNKGVISLKRLNDKEFELKKLKYELKKKKVDGDERREIIFEKLRYCSNKRQHEIFEICKKICSMVRNNNVKYFCIEKLDMKSKDNQMGKRFNRLVNNLWCRNALESNLNKRLKVMDVELLKLYPQYSSFIGNILYKKYNLPDMINASIEMSRRYYFYIEKYHRNNIKIVDIIYPDWEKSQIILNESMEERFKINDFTNWKEFYLYIKNSKLRYRISLEDIKSNVFRMNNIKSYVDLYTYT